MMQQLIIRCRITIINNPTNGSQTILGTGVVSTTTVLSEATTIVPEVVVMVSTTITTTIIIMMVVRATFVGEEAT